MAKCLQPTWKRRIGLLIQKLQPIFNNTVINNKLGYNIELTRRQYSGNENQVVCFLSAAKFVGLRIVNCIYFNRGMNNYGL